jgi:hypothetical protein
MLVCCLYVVNVLVLVGETVWLRALELPTSFEGEGGLASYRAYCISVDMDSILYLFRSCKRNIQGKITLTSFPVNEIPTRTSCP